MNARARGFSTADRFCVASFLVDLSHYLVFGALPFLAMQLGGGPFEMGLLPTLYAATYVVASMLAGKLSDRVGRLALLRVGIVLFALACAAIAVADRLALVLVLVSITGVALGFFWSPAQAALSDSVAPAGLGRAIARFNVGWSAGKGLGFFLAGVITAAARPEYAVLAGIAPLAAALYILARANVAAGAPAGDLAPEAPVPNEWAAVSRRLVFLAWGANAVAYGVSSTLNVHAPAILEARGGSALDFGLFLGLVFAAQTVAFAFTGRLAPTGRAIVVAHTLAFISLASFLVAPNTLGFVVAAAPLGLGLAISYQASLHASLHRDADRGLAAGIHESILATGSSVVPLVGGAFAASGGGTAAPLHVCLALLLAAGAATAVLDRKNRSKPAKNREDLASERQPAAVADHSGI